MIDAPELTAVLACREDGAEIIAQLGTTLALWRRGEWRVVVANVWRSGELEGDFGASFVLGPPAGVAATTADLTLGAVNGQGVLPWTRPARYRASYTSVTVDLRHQLWAQSVHSVWVHVGSLGSDRSTQFNIRAEGPVRFGPSGSLAVVAGGSGVGLFDLRSDEQQELHRGSGGQLVAAWGDTDKRLAYSHEGDGQWWLAGYNATRSQVLWDTPLTEQPLGIVPAGDGWVLLTESRLVEVDGRGRVRGTRTTSVAPGAGVNGEHVFVGCGESTFAVAGQDQIAIMSCCRGDQNADRPPG